MLCLLANDEPAAIATDLFTTIEEIASQIRREDVPMEVQSVFNGPILNQGLSLKDN